MSINKFKYLKWYSTICFLVIIIALFYVIFNVNILVLQIIFSGLLSIITGIFGYLILKWRKQI